MTLMTDKTMPIVVAALAGSLVGVLLLWLGARGEQAALVELISRAELTPECRAELDRGIKSIIEDWEGAPAQSE